MMFLTTKELHKMTGRKRKQPCIRWLTQNGFRFTVSADGWPNVLRSEAIERHSRGKETLGKAPRVNLEPFMEGSHGA